MTLLEKLNLFYNSYVLTILTVGYIAGELGHYLIGITSKQTAIDIHYGDHACQQNTSMFHSSHLPVKCSDVTEPKGYVLNIAHCTLRKLIVWRRGRRKAHAAAE